MFENSIFKIEFSILSGFFPHHNLYRLIFQSFVLREQALEFWNLGLKTNLFRCVRLEIVESSDTNMVWGDMGVRQSPMNSLPSSDFHNDHTYKHSGINVTFVLRKPPDEGWAAEIMICSTACPKLTAIRTPLLKYTAHAPVTPKAKRDKFINPAIFRWHIFFFPIIRNESDL